MPLYTYACSCGFATEELEREPVDVRQCPVCDKRTLKRTIASTSRIQLRGASVMHNRHRVTRGRGY